MPLPAGTNVGFAQGNSPFPASPLPPVTRCPPPPSHHALQLLRQPGEQAEVLLGHQRGALLQRVAGQAPGARVQRVQVAHRCAQRGRPPRLRRPACSTQRACQPSAGPSKRS